MSILDVVNATSRSVNEKTKNMQEVANLKKKITYERERIYEVFAEIGEKFYNMDPNNQDFSELRVLCDDVNTRKRRIKKMMFSLHNMRGFKICPQCKAEVNGKFKFCGSCGARIPEPDEAEFLDMEGLGFGTESVEENE
ncbi:MAG: zinc ribbon domain-containing protein [Oscillospiraceae bacterium]|nr:zinc ribbon domain-containing protein [Oscillospiraceae bacterium]